MPRRGLYSSCLERYGYTTYRQGLEAAEDSLQHLTNRTLDDIPKAIRILSPPENVAHTLDVVTSGASRFSKRLLYTNARRSCLYCSRVATIRWGDLP